MILYMSVSTFDSNPSPYCSPIEAEQHLRCLHLQVSRLEHPATYPHSTAGVVHSDLSHYHPAGS